MKAHTEFHHRYQHSPSILFERKVKTPNCQRRIKNLTFSGA